MKELLAGLGLLLVVAVAGFSYRLIIEKPQSPAVQACTQEARVCPDGSSVGRTGPSCAFAPCAAPNLELPEINATIVVPQGYTRISGEGTVATFTTSTTDPSATFISIRKYPIPSGKDFKSVLLGETVFGASGENAKSLDAFTKVTIGGRDYYSVQIERFEGVVSTSYYLVRPADVLRFDVVEHDVMDWTDPKLNVENLPAHTALRSLLETAQVQ